MIFPIFPLIPVLVFLFPLAVYCLIVSLLNRRPRPVMVSGTWDFVGVLFAVSGFLLLGGPVMLTSLSERWRFTWLLGRPPGPALFGEGGASFWVLLALLYFVAVVGGAAYLLLRRRHSTSIYNIVPGRLEETLADVLDRLGLAWTRAGNRFFISPANGRPGGLGEPAPSPAVLGRLGGGYPAMAETRPAADPLLNGPTSYEQTGVVLLDAFPTLRHVTLHWEEGAGTLRQEVEAELERALAQVYAGHNPAGTWFMTAAACLFCAIFFGLLLLLILMVVQR